MLGFRVSVAVRALKFVSATSALIVTRATSRSLEQHRADALEHLPGACFSNSAATSTLTPVL
jgi:hypothetical protein